MNIINKEDNLFYIGGVVRDEILDCENFDIDMVYVGNAIEFAKSLDGIEILQINEPFGTVRIKDGEKEVDIASTRCESYPKAGHLPQVSSLGCSLKDDVLRRDFTINALAKSYKTGEIIDYTGGIEDIKNKKIRILHDKSFIDDPTRILRALKFSIRFDFELDEKTQKLQDNYLQNVNYDMCFKRVKKELVETFNLNSQKAFEKFIEGKIYKLFTEKEIVLPKVNFEDLIKKYKIKNPWLVYMAAIDTLDRLPLTKEERKVVEDVENLKNSDFSDDFKIYKAFSNKNIRSILAFSATNFEVVNKYLNELKDIKLHIKGDDLIGLGYTPSGNFKLCFDYVLKEKIKNKNMSKPDEIRLAHDFFVNIH